MKIFKFQLLFTVIIVFFITITTCYATSSNGTYALDKVPYRLNNQIAIQNGAKLFVNYCLNCHSASSVRYSSLKKIGLTDDQVNKNLLFTDDKISDFMKISMLSKDAKEWFGNIPPDLSLIARSKGVDYLYTYLRTFYKDDSKISGWNNLVFPDVGMPHVMWELQGIRIAKFINQPDPHDPTKTIRVFDGFQQELPGKLDNREFDSSMADLVTYLQWMSDPIQLDRKRLGVFVIIFLSFFAFLSWGLNRAYWKDIK